MLNIVSITLQLPFILALSRLSGQPDFGDDLSIHSDRHTYATLLLHKTSILCYVQKQLGHSSLNMTSLYADIMQEENGEIANKILDD